MRDTIFDECSLNRNRVKWEDYLYKMTPVHFWEDMYLKREDYFAPLGYAGINGAKLRQCIWLTNEYIKRGGVDGVISGASVLSPQLPMGSAVAYHYGLNSMHVIGATRPDVCMKKEMVKMATWFDAEFYFIKVAYNPCLQRKVKQLKAGEYKNYYELNYGIAVDPEEKINKIIEFHNLSGNQVQNIPEHITDLVIPSGSCNSTISILYGLAKYRPLKKLNVHLVGIGPSKIKFIYERLKLIKENSKINTLNYTKKFDNEIFKSEVGDDSYDLYYYDLHSTGYVDYQQQMKYDFGGIELHPTYEGKVMTYLRDKLPHLANENTLFWIVGSKPYLVEMEYFRRELGNFPVEPNVIKNEWEEKSDNGQIRFV